MKTDELTQRQDRSQAETYVIAKTAEGFRICAPMNPAQQYVVSGIPQNPQCTCADFQEHRGDPAWSCKHILAVLAHVRPAGVRVGVPTTPAAAVDARDRNGSHHPEPGKNGAGTSGVAHMLLRRSVSPDGRIDSLSVEFACPVGHASPETIKSSAEEALRVQAGIVSAFLRSPGTADERPASPSCGSKPSGNGAVAARLIKVEGIPTRWGRRLFISVAVKDGTLKFFGSQEQLADALRTAGLGQLAERVSEGCILDAPCTVTTKPSKDGKYVNVDQILPAPDGDSR